MVSGYRRKKAGHVSQHKSKVVNILFMVTGLRVNLNIDDNPIDSRPTKYDPKINESL